MKIALLLSGPSRGLAHVAKTWSFLEHVNDVYFFMRAPLDAGEKYLGDIPEFNGNKHWRRSVDPDYDSKLKWGSYMLDEPSKHEWVSGRAMDVRPYYAHPPGVILGMAWYMRQQAFKLIDKPEQYDLIAYVRPDQFLINELPIEKLTPDKFWTPQFHRRGGLNDRIAVGSPAVMQHYCNMYDHLNDDINTLQVGNMEERLANWMLKMPGIAFGWTSTDFYFVKADGTHRIIPPAEYGSYTLPRYQQALSGLEVR